MAGVTEIIGIPAPRQGGAGGGFDSDEFRAGADAGEGVLHEGRHQAAQVGAAAGTADDDVGIFADLFHRRFGFQADDGLVEQHLVEHRTEYIAAAGGVQGLFDRLRNRAAQRAAGARMGFQDGAPDFGGVGGAGDDIGAESLDDSLAERLLLVADLDHVDGQIQAVMGAGHRKRGAPLTGARFGGQAGQALFFGVIHLGGGGIELVGSGRVVSFEFVIDFRGSIQRPFKIICPDQGRGSKMR